MAIKKSDRIVVYEKHNGRCAYCGKQIQLKDMQVDHIVSKRNGGKDSMDNYNPACRRCNHYKRAGDIEYLRAMLQTAHHRLKKDYLVCVAIDYGIVTIKPFDGQFYFEKVDGEVKR